MFISQLLQIAQTNFNFLFFIQKQCCTYFQIRKNIRCICITLTTVTLHTKTSLCPGSFSHAERGNELKQGCAKTYRPVQKLRFSSWTLCICLTAIDTADNDPHKDPYRTEEGDDTVEEVVRTIISHRLQGGRHRSYRSNHTDCMGMNTKSCVSR